MAKKRNINITSYVKQFGLALLVGSRKRYVWLVVIIGLLLFSLWFLYEGVWQPLRQDVPLPAGVAPESPRLNVETLRSINTFRVERTEGARANFAPFATIFIEIAESPPAN